MCYYIIQNTIETIRHSFPGSTSKDLGGGASVLISTLALPRRRTECRPSRLHHVTVSRGQIMAPALACARMRLSVALRDRPGRAESREGDRSGSLRRGPRPKTLTACNELSHAFSSRGFIPCRLAEPRPRIRDCLTPRVCVAS